MAAPNFGLIYWPIQPDYIKDKCLIQPFLKAYILTFLQQFSNICLSLTSLSKILSHESWVRGLFPHTVHEKILLNNDWAVKVWIAPWKTLTLNCSFGTSSFFFEMLIQSFRLSCFNQTDHGCGSRPPPSNYWSSLGTCFWSTEVIDIMSNGSSILKMV